MKYPHLFEPIKIGNTLFRNRIFAAPTGHPDNVMGKFSEDVIAYFEHKAKGGAAAVTLGEACVDSVYGKGYASELSLDTRQPLRGLALVADAIRRHGAVPSIELQHPGMKATPCVYTPGVGTADVAVELTVVCEIVLSGRNGLDILRVVAHEATDVCVTDYIDEIRILTERLTGTAPAWVTDRLDDRAPEGKALAAGIEDCTCLISDYGSLESCEIRIPC